MKDLTLVVMAAGMGSRFGGLKQIEPVGMNNEFILDFSVYDALKAGFDKVVFVIKEEHLEIFKETVGKRIGDKIKVEYAFQKFDDVPENVKIPEGRTKPWGTTQAILSAKNYVTGNFVVINADDFYGQEAYVKAVDFFKNSKDDNEYACITYPYIKTSSKYGSVKRAVCYLENDYIVKMVECSIKTVNDKAYCEPLNGDEAFYQDPYVPVSMNMYCFKNNFFQLLEESFKEFFANAKNLEKDEALLPDCVTKNINNKKIVLKNETTNASWLGVTYREDLPYVKESIKKLISSKIYKEDLWS